MSKKLCSRSITFRVDEETFSKLSYIAGLSYSSGSVSRLLKFILSSYLSSCSSVPTKPSIPITSITSIAPTSPNDSSLTTESTSST